MTGVQVIPYREPTTHGEGDFRVTLKVRNNPLLSAIEKDAGSVLAFCKKHKFSPQIVYEFVNLKRDPFEAGWTPTAMRLSDVLGELPEDLFPPDTRVALERNVASFAMRATEVAALLEEHNRPENAYERLELKQHVAEALDKLTPQMRKVIERRFGLNGPQCTLDEVAAALDLSRERIRQLQSQGLSRLRHPENSEKIRTWLAEPEPEQPPPERSPALPRARIVQDIPPRDLRDELANPLALRPSLEAAQLIAAQIPADAMTACTKRGEPWQTWTRRLFWDTYQQDLWRRGIEIEYGVMSEIILAAAAQALASLDANGATPTP